MTTQQMIDAQGMIEKYRYILRAIEGATERHSKWVDCVLEMHSKGYTVAMESEVQLELGF